MTDVIKRIQNASEAAHKKYLRFLKRKQGEQHRAYKQIGKSVRAEILGAADDEGRIPFRRLPDLERVVGYNVEALGNWEDDWVPDALHESADLGLASMLTIAAIIGKPIPPPSVAAIPYHAVQFTQNHVAPNGLNLSSNLWKNHQFQKARINEALRKTVIEGESVRKTAQDLIGRGKPLGKSVQQAFGRTSSVKIGGEIHNLFTPKGKKNLLFNTERMLITETNRARGQAYTQTCRETDAVIGMRLVLSPAHKKRDICDTITAKDDHNLGPGGYPLDQIPEYPIHPLCLCLLIPIFRGDLYGWFDITSQMLLSMEDKFQANVVGLKLPLKFGHYGDKGAAGWIKALSADNGRLRALIEWTPAGIKAVREKEYRYLSAEYSENYKDNETGADR